MKFGIFNIILRSIIFYKKESIYQFLIIMFLAAVLTGSLLTGSSVRKSILRGNTDSLNGTGYIISSGNRYLPLSITDRYRAVSGERAEGLLEQKGWVRNFSTGVSALNVQIIGVENSFFTFDGNDEGLVIPDGEALVNHKLAEKLGLEPGDDIVVRLGTPSELPADSPFAPVTDSYESFVLGIAGILKDVNEENFSLGINQVKPMNLYLSLKNFKELFAGESNINRLIVKSRTGLEKEEINYDLEKIYTAGDAGIKIRETGVPGNNEIISDRVFISNNELEQVGDAIPEARPVLTYLANSISNNSRSTPYSFVSGLHPDLIDIVPSRGEIVINQWLADDLNAKLGDTLKVDYFVAGALKDFAEQSTSFTVSLIIDTESAINDPTLMPEFPGIAGSESCRDWDAGAPVDMTRIRDKDEDYWYNYNGTPKALINYFDAVSIWGNDFGPATSIRFTHSLTEEDINQKLIGSLNPFSTGITTIPIEENARNAAQNSVDFTSLFLGLGFFIFLSAVILLILTVSASLDSRIDHISLLRSMGFENRKIIRIQFTEVFIIAVTGSLVGIFAGGIIDKLLIGFLNSVWKGAVQTDTLESYSDIGGLLLGFVVSLSIVLITVRIQLRRQLGKVFTKEIRRKDGFVLRHIRWIFLLSCILVIITGTAAIIAGPSNSILWFGTGSLVLVSFILGISFWLKFRSNTIDNKSISRRKYFGAYFRMFPGKAITPIIFLAAGLFVVVVTGANRKSFEGTEISRSSGSGGFMIWGETATPLLYGLNSNRGKYEYNLDSDILENLFFVQAKKVDGDDASCLNLNQIDSPPILGIETSYFVEKGAFSFAETIDSDLNPWDMLSRKEEDNTIYGVADQTILQWSLFKGVGDTLIFASESGEELKVILAGGLNSSVFQGHIIIGADNFRKFYPSISGSTIFMAEGDIQTLDTSMASLGESLSQYGVDLQSTTKRLAAFYQVTNTYLDVFLALGGIGLILGVFGMGVVFLKNFNSRTREFALMLASGFTPRRIRSLVISEYLIILIAGVIIGTIPAPIATLPSLISDASIPFGLILIIVLMVVLTGTISILISVRSLVSNRLILNLRKE